MKTGFFTVLLLFAYSLAQACLDSQMGDLEELACEETMVIQEDPNYSRFFSLNSGS